MAEEIPERHSRPVETWNPVDHRAEACRLLEAARDFTGDNMIALLTAAQVHATMASANHWGANVQPVHDGREDRAARVSSVWTN